MSNTEATDSPAELSVQCPLCHALPYMSCVFDDGKRRELSHQARYDECARIINLALAAEIERTA